MDAIGHSANIDATVTLQDRREDLLVQIAERDLRRGRHAPLTHSQLNQKKLKHQSVLGLIAHAHPLS